MDAELEQQIRAFAFGRIGLGAVMVVAPQTALRRWAGGGSDQPVTKLIARFVGSRDIAIGVGTVMALRHGAPVRGWLEAGALADAGDLAATVLGFRHLRRVPALGTAVAAAGGVAWGRSLVSRLAASGSDDRPPASAVP